MPSIDNLLAGMEMNKTFGVKTCHKCHKTYEPIRRNQRFCTPLCGTIYNRRRAHGKFPADPEPNEQSTFENSKIDLDDLA